MSGRSYGVEQVATVTSDKLDDLILERGSVLWRLSSPSLLDASLISNHDPPPVARTDRVSWTLVRQTVPKLISLLYDLGIHQSFEAPEASEQ